MNRLPAKRFPVTIDGETTLIGTANELAIVLDVLHGNHDYVVLDQLRPHLAEITATPNGFIATMKSLEPANQIILVEAIGSKLAEILQRSNYLADLLATLTTQEVEDALLRALDTAGLRTLITTAYDLANILQWLYGHSDEKVLDLLGTEYVRAIIRTGDDLGRVLNALEAEAQSTLIETLGLVRIVDIARSGRELAYILRAIPPAQSACVLEQYSRAQLITLIGNARDWEYLWARLEPAEQTMLQQKLGVK